MEWMPGRKQKETKQQPGTAGPYIILGCCLVSLRFLCDIHCTPSPLYFQSFKCCIGRQNNETFVRIFTIFRNWVLKLIWDHPVRLCKYKDKVHAGVGNVNGALQILCCAVFFQVGPGLATLEAVRAEESVVDLLSYGLHNITLKGHLITFQRFQVGLDARFVPQPIRVSQCSN